jgi:hypothetical protein
MDARYNESMPARGVACSGEDLPSAAQQETKCAAEGKQRKTEEAKGQTKTVSSVTLRNERTNEEKMAMQEKREGKSVRLCADTGL